MRTLETPLELCLTSNVLSKSVPSYAAHHFGKHYQVRSIFKESGANSTKSEGDIEREKETGDPVILCTDDSAVFGSPLSREYAIAMSAFRIGRKEMAILAAEAIEATFLEEGHIKDALRKRAKDFVDGLE